MVLLIKVSLGLDGIVDVGRLSGYAAVRPCGGSGYTVQ